MGNGCIRGGGTIDLVLCGESLRLRIVDGWETTGKLARNSGVRDGRGAITAPRLTVQARGAHPHTRLVLHLDRAPTGGNLGLDDERRDL